MQTSVWVVWTEKFDAEEGTTIRTVVDSREKAELALKNLVQNDGRNWTHDWVHEEKLHLSGTEAIYLYAISTDAWAVAEKCNVE